MLKIISICIIALAITNANSAFAAKLYKWVDKDGNISYQDSPPPAGSTVIKEEEIKTLTPASPEQTSQSTTVFRQQAVIVYTVPNCPACVSLLEKLQSWNIPTTEESLQNRDVQARILEAGDSLSAPTLFVGDTLVVDHSDESLSSALQQAGYQTINTEETPEEANTQEGS